MTNDENLHADGVSPETRHQSPAAESPGYFKEALEDAERLLKYAAETGVEIDADTRSAVLQARIAFPTGLSEDIAAKLLLALTELAAKPVQSKAGAPATMPLKSSGKRCASIMAWPPPREQPVK